MLNHVFSLAQDQLINSIRFPPKDLLLWLIFPIKTIPRKLQHTPRTHPRQSPVRQLWKESLYSPVVKVAGVCSKGVLVHNLGTIILLSMFQHIKPRGQVFSCKSLPFVEHQLQVVHLNGICCYQKGGCPKSVAEAKARYEATCGVRRIPMKRAETYQKMTLVCNKGRSPYMEHPG